MIVKYYTKRYEIIKQGKYPANRKKQMLANLVNEMELAMKMPLEHNTESEIQNKAVLALYHQISTEKFI